MNYKPSSPVAIVSLSGVFPQASDCDQFWDNICHKVDTTREISQERWAGPFSWVSSDDFEIDKAYSRRACLIDDFDFDPSGFNIEQGLLLDMDPLCQWVMHASKAALEQTNIREMDNNRIGVILAAIALPTDISSKISRDIMGCQLVRQVIQPQPFRPVDPAAALSGRVVGVPAAMVSLGLGLGGTSYTLDAACASSLYAVKLACDELQARRADAMIAGGVSRPDCLYTQTGFSQLRALSPSGRCAPFDHSADGLVVGEGAGVMVLKRLEDAISHGDTIYGVIRGIGLSNDMRGNLLAPESDGQLRAMQSAYAQAGWHPCDVDYIECHGAGTPVGDATELQSLRTLWGQDGWQKGQCAIGSIKSMMGHLLTAAGAAGMIKTLLALYYKTLPPTLKFERPKPTSPLIDSPFRVQTDPQPWPDKNDGTPRKAAVSAFGFGGINAHVLIEEWRQPVGAGPRTCTSQQGDNAKNDRSAPPVGAGPCACPSSQTPNIENDQHTTNEIQKPGLRTPRQDAIAIAGMDLHLGTLDSLQSFQHAVFNAHTAIAEAPPERWKAPAYAHDLFGTQWKGSFIDHLSVEIGEFQIPPGEIPEILPQQLLMLKVAAGAMDDAGLVLRQARERMGTIIGIGFDYEATNFHLRWALPAMAAQWKGTLALPDDPDERNQWLLKAKDDCGPPLTASRTLGALGGIVASRIAREFRFGGPSFVVSAEEASGLQAVEIARRMLQSHEVDAMLVGAVDLNCDERSMATLYSRLGLSAIGQIRPFDVGADGTLPGEGAVALVLKRLEDAKADNDRIYAVIEGIGSASGRVDDHFVPDETVYCNSLDLALEDAQADPAQIDVMECHSGGIPSQDLMEAQALHRCFGKEKSFDEEKRIAVGTVKSIIGHTGATSGLTSLAKTALSLFHRIIPPVGHFTKPSQRQWRQGVFHFPIQPVYWAANRLDGPRKACVASITSNGQCMHAVMGQVDTKGAHGSGESYRHRRPMGPLPHGLFVIKGDNKIEILEGLNRLENLTKEINGDSTAPMESLAHQWYLQSLSLHRPSGKNPQCLAIVAGSEQVLQSHLQNARKAVENDRSLRMNLRGGVCYDPEKARYQGETAFIYPGSGNHYIGMGRTLGAHWPKVLREMDENTDLFKSQLLPQWYDPWRVDWSEGWPQEAYSDLVSDPLHTIFGQVLFGGQMTGLLKKFKLFPDAVIGYSLGESAGLFATGAWPDRGQMLQRLEASDLFKTQLAGPCEAVRKAWKIPVDQAIDWKVAAVNRDARTVDEAISDLPYLRRLIVNTPNQCVIGGLQKQVQTAVERMKCTAVYLDGVVTVHCDAGLPAAEAYKELHRFETTPIDNVRFYSCAFEKALDLTSETAAASITQQAMEGFNFPRAIEKAYSDGVRIFIEIGPHCSCTRMIDRILDDKPHLAVAANHRSEFEPLTLLKCLGTLAAAGVEIDLDAIYGYPENHFDAASKNSATAIRVPVGGKPLSLRLPAKPAVEKKPHPQSTDEIRSTTKPEPAPTKPGECAGNSTMGPGLDFNAMIDQLNENVAATAKTHEQFLEFSQELTTQYGKALEWQSQMMAALDSDNIDWESSKNLHDVHKIEDQKKPQTPVAFDRTQCMEFAIGSVGKMLGPAFDIIDTYKVRVRLPDEPLMLVDRIISLEGEKLGLSSGRVITEHDVSADAWYLDGNRAPVCISVEAGQADLFLCAYLGIDHQVKGERTYRLLDAKIRFHRGLPRPGETIRYDIRIDKFVRQEETYLFFFRFEGYIGHEHLITMTDGCAGFFTEEEVRNSGGIILTEDDKTSGAPIGGTPYIPLVELFEESYDDAQIEDLRRGDAEACFGPQFRGIKLPEALRQPKGRMRLIHRIVSLDPRGGRFGKGYVKAEADIHPDDWFLTCHFVDDMVMPGTLMYECCAHTLRVLLLRLGWVTDKTDVCYEPVRDLPCRLKCRGPVTPATHRVHYAVEIKEIGYHPEPYVIADAHMHADGHYIVFFKDMSMQMTNVTEQDIQRFWRERSAGKTDPLSVHHRPHPEPLFTREHILEFAIGRPSKAFGAPYAVFDRDRTIARLPGPPYCFMDRITSIESEPWMLQPDGWVEAQYDVPADAWYFAADRSGVMPFCVLLEIALQPCGWLAAFAGSALKSENDLRFRNLGGKAVLHANVLPVDQTLTMRTRITKVSDAADMIIEHFDFKVLIDRQPIYTGTTYFGFFTSRALAQQVGLRESLYAPTDNDISHVISHSFGNDEPLTPDDTPAGVAFRPKGMKMPGKALCMIDGVDIYCPDGGGHGLGYIRGYKVVDENEWFFKAHFYQDPVCPGSLGIESFLQLIKFAAMERWPHLKHTHRFESACSLEHQWSYRGQVIPANKKVYVDAQITRVEEGDSPMMMADGSLQVDGIYIYKMDGFGLRLVPI